MITGSPMLNEAKAIASFGGRLAFAVSLGKDAAAMLHIMSQLTDMKRHYFFYWSFYPKTLPYQTRYINMLERKYGIKIDVLMWPKLTGTKQAVAVNEILEKQKCSLALFGYRMDESLQRRGMLKSLTNGIDLTRRWAYPIRSFTSKTVMAYINVNNIQIQPEYKLGLKNDLQTHRGAGAAILRHFISEEDYQCAIAQDKNVEIDYVRLINDKQAFEEVFGNEEKGIRGLTKGFHCSNPPKRDRS